METHKILHNHIRTGLFNFFTDDDIHNWSFNLYDDNNYVLHKIYDKKHLYMILNNSAIYQYYYELKNEIDDDGSCPIIDGKVKYETIKNIVLINNNLYMICHQDYIFNELLLINFDNFHIMYDNDQIVYSFYDYIIEGDNYILSEKDNKNSKTIDIFLDIINKKILIYENDNLEYYLYYDVHNPNA